METRNNDEVRAQVRTAYAKVAQGQDGCAVGCCGTQGAGSLTLGYTADDLASVPEGADLGLGCGNPQAIAALKLEYAHGCSMDMADTLQRVPVELTSVRDYAQRVAAARTATV